MKIEKLQADRKRTVKIPVGINEKGEGVFEELAIWHRPLTPAVDQQVHEIALEILKARGETVDADAPEQPEQTGKSKPVLVAQLAFLLTGWDVTEGGDRVTPDEGRLMSLEWEVLGAIRDAIFEPIFPKATT